MATVALKATYKKKNIVLPVNCKNWQLQLSEFKKDLRKMKTLSFLSTARTDNPFCKTYPKPVRRYAFH